MRRHTRTSYRLLILALLGGITSAVSGQVPVNPAEEQRIERMWQQHWREFAAFCLEHDGRYVCFPTYDRTRANSSGLVAKDYLKQSARNFTVRDDKGRDVEKTMTKPQGEVDVMVKLLPAARPGEYGIIHSGLIESIDGPDRMTLREVWLLDSDKMRSEYEATMEELRRQSWRDAEDAIRDRDRRGPGIMDRHFRGRDLLEWQYEERESAARWQRRRSDMSWQVVGFDTRSLVASRRWPAAGHDGVPVAVVAASESSVTVVPASRLGKGVTEDQFRQVLEQRGLTLHRFVEIVTEQKRTNPMSYRDAVLSAIEGKAAGAPDVNTQVREAD